MYALKLFVLLYRTSLWCLCRGQAWIGKSVLEDFQDDFVVDLGPDISGWATHSWFIKTHFIALWSDQSVYCFILCHDFLMTLCVFLRQFMFPGSVLYNLDEDESEGGIAINLLPLMAQDQQHKTDTSQPAVKRERSLQNTVY